MSARKERKPRAERGMPEELLYEIFSGFPRPAYPFSDITPDYLQRLRDECHQWIEQDCHFNSPADRARHQRHHFSDLPARALPYLSYAEQLPICRFTAFGAIVDDYLDQADHDETSAIRERLLDCMLGRYAPAQADPGFYRQFRRVHDDARDVGVPDPIYRPFVAAIDDMFTGFAGEKQWNASDTPPPLPVYTALRANTSGAIPFCKYVPLQRDHRVLPGEVLEHPCILRMHWLSGLLVGYHNDLASLPKELSRKGDVINIVMVLARERSICLEDAWYAAMELHDAALHEFVTLQQNLPDFGRWQDKARLYADDLGTNIQGIYSWHHKNTLRYVPGAYVEPSFVSGTRPTDPDRQARQ